MNGFFLCFYWFIKFLFSSCYHNIMVYPLSRSCLEIYFGIPKTYVNYCLVFLFRFSLPLNSVTSSAIYFIVTNNSSFQLIQTGNVSVIMSLPRELVLMFSELIFACIQLFLPHYVFRIHFHSCKYIYTYAVEPLISDLNGTRLRSEYKKKSYNEKGARKSLLKIVQH